MTARRILILITALWIAGLLPALAQRQMEKLGRGVIAIKSSSTQVYVGWRLLGNDPRDLAFNLYRAANGGTPTKIAGPITTTTNYLDTPGSLSTTAYTYTVRPVINGIEVADTWANPLSGGFTLPANAPTRQYLPVPIQPTPDDAAAGVSYNVKFCWVGDFDGDGEYDFLIDRTNPNVEAKQWLQAYKRDGALLWQMDMGPNSVNHYNITPGSSSIGIGHGDNVTVYDLDGDGKAEVIVRTANGVVFANGTTLTAPDNEVQSISILDGLTGAEKARATVPIPADWATKTHVQGQMGIVYADGVKPSIFYHASNRNADSSFNKYAATWDYRNGQLTQRWLWLERGLHTAEAHQVRFADVDNDGKDEYVDIGHVVKSDGSGQINEGVLTEVVHGDRFHVADIDPDRPGLETFLIQQNNGTGLATVYSAADKSAVIKKWYASGVVDVGRGTVGDFVPTVKGLEFFSTQPGTFDCKTNQLYSTQPFPPETIWWDGDLGREFLSTIGSSATSPGIDKFNTANGGTSRVLSLYSDPAAPKSPYNNYIAYGGRPQFWGDILGDWREELLCVATDNSELRIYTTKTMDAAKTFNGQNFRIYTLMHNPQYRVQATTKGYVQSSYVDYYLGNGMPPPPPPPMVDARLVWRGGAGATTWDAGATSSWSNAGANSTYADGDTVRFDISGNNATAVTLAGTLSPGAATVYSPKDYTFAGTGVLAGTMTLTKAGAGTMMLPGTHTFTGGTTVWDGALLVNGDLQGSPVTVWGGTWGGALAAGKTGGRIGGTGRYSKAVTVKYRGAITPGAGMNNAGTVTFGGGLTMEDGSTLAMDLSNTPTTAASSDRIAVTGNLTLTGKVNIIVNPLNTSLAAGTYTLATYTGTLTGGTSNLAVTVPAGTPYTLAATGGAITLTVPTTRTAAAVTWRGSGTDWDLATSQNWLTGGVADVFVSGDTVTFDATGAAKPTVNLTGALPVGGVTVNAATNYTFNGAGSISGAGGLDKSGAGTLTINTSNDYTGPTSITGGVLEVSALGDAGSASSIGASTGEASNLVIDGGTLRLTGAQTNTNRNATLGASGGTIDVANAGSSIQISGALGGSGSLTKEGPGTVLLASANTYTGGTTINAGTIYLAGATPNSSGLGTGPVTINNGTLTMADVQASETAAWNLVVPAGATARLNADGRCTLTGALTGSGTFTYYSGYVRTDLKGNWSAFAGRINAVTDSDGGDFRVTNTYGFGSAALNLGDQVYAYYNSTPPSGGLTLDIGELSGVATAHLLGGPTGGRTVTWRIGGRNSDSTYAGVIADSGGPTAITKIGTGTLTLSGTNSFTGATLVSAGTLAVSGSATNASTVEVLSGATLNLTGTLTTGTLTIRAGGRLIGGGTVHATIVNEGLIEATAGAQFGFAGSLTNKGTMRFLNGAKFTQTGGTFTNNGTLDLLTAGTSTSPSTGMGRTYLAADLKAASFSLAGGTTPTLTLLTLSGHTYQLERSLSIDNPTWSAVGTALAGNDATQSFADPSPPNSPSAFYRVTLSP
jgi:autotransporter-associated beta strand protein